MVLKQQQLMIKKLDPFYELKQYNAIIVFISILV